MLGKNTSNPKSAKEAQGNSKADAKGSSADGNIETKPASDNPKKKDSQLEELSVERDKSKAEEWKVDMFSKAGYVYDPSKKTYDIAPAFTSYPKIQIPAIFGDIG